ncbi:MAG: hypothetical protein Alis3KO_38950 [Aliiglaciecola sp.]
MGFLLGEHDILGFRFAVQPWQDEAVDLSFGDLSLKWEVSLNYWEVGGSGENNWAFSFSPILSSQLTTLPYDIDVSWELGIGISMHSKHHFGVKNLGSRVLFEDRLSLVFLISERKNSRVTLSAIHYSNAGFSSHNPGINLISIVYHQPI